jgi:hypothetical protein
MVETPSPILDTLPTPELLRARLSELATEANFLRSLLRVLERSRVARRRSPRQEREAALA